MKRIILLALIGMLSVIGAYGHEAFTLVSSEKLTVTSAQLLELQKQASVGKAEGTNLTFTDSSIKLVVVTVPEDDMLSFRIQGMRNPTIVARRTPSSQFGS